MFQFFTKDYAGLSAQMLNWIAMGTGILIVLLILLVIIRLLRGSRLGSGRRGRHARLAVTDAASIGDDRRKLVLVRRDNVEHLLLIGGSNDLVIESDIVRTAPQQTAARVPVALSAATAAAPAASPAPVSHVAKPAESSIQPTAAPATPAPAPQTTAPTPAVAVAPITAPTAAPVASPTPAAASNPAPAPSTSSAPVAVAAVAATGAAIASSVPSETPTAPHEGESEGNPTDQTEIWDDSSVESAAIIDTEPNLESTIENPAAAPVPASPVQTAAVSQMNSVEEMDALLNEITTEK